MLPEVFVHPAAIILSDKRKKHRTLKTIDYSELHLLCVYSI